MVDRLHYRAGCALRFFNRSRSVLTTIHHYPKRYRAKCDVTALKRYTEIRDAELIVLLERVALCCVIAAGYLLVGGTQGLAENLKRAPMIVSLCPPPPPTAPTLNRHHPCWAGLELLARAIFVI